MVIYKITNKINGKIYIGQTVQKLEDRWHDHVRGDKNQNSYIHRAIQKYGPDNFLLEVVAVAKNLTALNILEEHYIEKSDSLAPFGYNLLKGGDSREVHQDTKDKISDTLKAKEPGSHFGGKRWDKGFKGKHSEETKDKISSALKGRPITNRWDKGNKTPRSEETKAKLSLALKGVPQRSKYKPVLVVETGIVYESVSTAAQAVGLHRTTVSTLIKTGKRHYKLNLTFKLAA